MSKKDLNLCFPDSKFNAYLNHFEVAGMLVMKVQVKYSGISEDVSIDSDCESSEASQRRGVSFLHGARNTHIHAR